MRHLVHKAAESAAGATRVEFDAVVSRVIKALSGVDISLPIRLIIEADEPTTIGKASPATEAVIAKTIPVIKTDEERFVLGVVLEPTKEMGQPDTQRDVYSADEVRKAAFAFMEDFQVVGLQHRADISDRVRILLNWIATEDMTLNGQTVVKGTWLMGVRVQDDDLWSAVKKGEITGFSIGGSAKREPVAVAQ